LSESQPIPSGLLRPFFLNLALMVDCFFILAPVCPRNPAPKLRSDSHFPRTIPARSTQPPFLVTLRAGSNFSSSLTVRTILSYCSLFSPPRFRRLTAGVFDSTRMFQRFLSIFRSSPCSVAIFPHADLGRSRFNLDRQNCRFLNPTVWSVAFLVCLGQFLSFPALAFIFYPSQTNFLFPFLFGPPRPFSFFLIPIEHPHPSSTIEDLPFSY